MRTLGSVTLVGGMVVVLASASLWMNASTSQAALAHASNATVVLVNEGFEAQFPPSGWAASGHWGKSDCEASSGSYSAWIEGSGGKPCSGLESLYHPNEAAKLKLGPIDLTNAVTASLQFDAWLWLGSGDVLTWEVSLNDSTYHGVSVTEIFSPSWRQRSLDLAAVPGLGDIRGQPSVWIAFTWQSDNFDQSFKGVLIDNVLVAKGVGGTADPPSPTHTQAPIQSATPEVRVFLPNLSKAASPTTQPSPTATHSPGNHAPQFPSPLQSTSATSFQYDGNGRLVGAVTTITVLSAATDSDGDSVSYAWTSTNGSISGNGLVGTWTRLLVGGRIQGGTASITASDGKGGTDIHSFVFP
jgi:hypothetical protein